MTVPQAAEYAQVHLTTIQRWVKVGFLPFHKAMHGGAFRIWPADVDRCKELAPTMRGKLTPQRPGILRARAKYGQKERDIAREGMRQWRLRKKLRQGA